MFASGMSEAASCRIQWEVKFLARACADVSARRAEPRRLLLRFTLSALAGIQRGVLGEPAALLVHRHAGLFGC